MLLRKKILLLRILLRNQGIKAYKVVTKEGYIESVRKTT
jgi:hypothetical protein